MLWEDTEVSHLAAEGDTLNSNKNYAVILYYKLGE